MIGAEEGLESTSQQNSSEEILNQLILNIKALMFLDTSEKESLEEIVNKQLSNSHDEQVRRFLRLIQTKKKKGKIQDHLLIAVGELIVASFLVIAGLATILPSVLGLTSPQELVTFIGQITSNVSVQTLSDPIVPALELLLAMLLLLGAFHTVRLAALNLHEIEITTSHPISSLE